VNAGVVEGFFTVECQPGTVSGDNWEHDITAARWPIPTHYSDLQRVFGWWRTVGDGAREIERRALEPVGWGE